MFQTLGDVVTCGLVIAALLVVPYKLARVWLKPQIDRVIGLFVMSRDVEGAADSAGMDLVSIPVSDTGIADDTTSEGLDINEGWLPPRVGRRLSDQELLIFLALQRGVSGSKYRFSANEILALLGGNRNKVLKQIADIRESPPAPQVREHQEQLNQLQSKH